MTITRLCVSSRVARRLSRTMHANKLKIDLYSTLYNERLSDDKIEVQIAL